MKAMYSVLLHFFVVFIYILPISCLIRSAEKSFVKERLKMLEKCRDYKESLLVKEGKTDKNKLSAHYDSCDCGRESTERIPFVYRIVSTDFVQPLHRYPWQVQVRIGAELWGAGVIINPNYVLTGGHVAQQILSTAAYKVDNEVNIKDALVAVASQNRNTQFVIYRIHQVKIHPSYGTAGKYPIYDIALLKLKDTIIFSKRIRPICLTMNKDLEKVGLNATVIGWGQMEQGGNITRRLKQGKVPIVDSRKCKKQLYKNKKAIGDFTICAGGSKFEDTCEGDSGGPLQIQDECEQWNLIGLTSWGELCAENNKPGVYTRVSFFLNWILDNTLDSLSCDSVNAQRIEPNLKECGLPSYRYMKTGITVQILTNPWVVNLYLGKKYLGNGVLINSTTVLTTTTVVNPWGPSLKPAKFKAHFGTPAYHQNGTDFLYDFAYVKDIIFHPMGEHRFDLCLLVLGVPMADTLMKFHPICFSNMKIKFEVGDKVDITSYTGAFMHLSKVATGRLQKFSKCRKWSYSAFYRHRSWCVAQDSKNYIPETFDSQWKESCQEEIGAVISRSIEGRHYLLGMTAVAPSKCDSPRSFHDVNWALAWIRVVTTMLDTA